MSSAPTTSAFLAAAGLGLAAWSLAGLPEPGLAGPQAAVFLDGPPEYGWRLPPGFPVPRVPADNPMSAAKVELGRHLFYDRRLSASGTAACASCHRQKLAFTDGLPRALGATGELHPRSSMSLANVAYNRSFAWADPTLESLEHQAAVPMFNRDPVELGVEGSGEAMARRLGLDRRYEAMFAAAFPEEEAAARIRLETVIRALTAFERTLISGESAYDRWVYRDERSAMSEEARRGMRLFFSERLGCSECHGGFTFSGPVTYRGAPEIGPAFHNTGLYNLGDEGLYPRPNQGLASFTGKPADMGRFRAPTLRNVALTAPYMHDGSIATLGEVVDHYAAGGRSGDNPHKSPLIHGFRQTAGEKRDLVAFLESLTDRSFVTDPRFADPFAAAGG